MILPVVRGHISARFNQPRPLGGVQTHVHGALDVSGGTLVAQAPVTGEAQLFQFIRPTKQITWHHNEKPEILKLIPHPYFYDLYGGIITITEPSGRYHIMTHFWGASLWGKKSFHYLESLEDDRFPCIALYSEKFTVREGELLMPVGNAGFSTGAHVHWEIHHSPQIEEYSLRLDPEELLLEEGRG